MNYRNWLIRICTFLGGIYFFLEFFLPAEIGGFKFSAWHDQITKGFIVIGSMAVGLGLINLLYVHGSKIVFRKKGRLNSVALLLGLLAMFVITVSDWSSSLTVSEGVSKVFNLAGFCEVIKTDYESSKEGVPELSVRIAGLKRALSALGAEIESEQSDASGVVKDLNQGLDAFEEKSEKKQIEAIAGTAQGLMKLAIIRRDYLNKQYEEAVTRKIYQIFYNGLFIPLGSSMFALLGFYIATAAYRAFRIKSFESGLMMTTAVIVMLGQIPFGVWLWKGLPIIRLWLLEVPNSAAFRAIEIGASIAGLVMAFRMWLSIESQSFTETDE